MPHRARGPTGGSHDDRTTGAVLPAAARPGRNLGLDYDPGCRPRCSHRPDHLPGPLDTVIALPGAPTSIPLFLLLFACTYFVLERLSAGTFSQPLTRSDSLYFTVTVFSTVGFGDITPKTELARLLVTGQMITDVIILGLAVKIIVGAVKSRRPGTVR